MTIIELIFLAIGLAMDCFAVSLSNGLVLKKFRWKIILIIALSFGFFQGFMPIIGWVASNSFKDIIQSYDHWIASGILFYLGGKMIIDSIRSKGIEECNCNLHKPKIILIQSIATSIDALTIGISFTCVGINTFKQLITPVVIIGITSFLASILAFCISIKYGKKYADKIKAEFWGGLILIAIGLKTLIQHLIYDI